MSLGTRLSSHLHQTNKEVSPSNDLGGGFCS